MQRKHVDHIQDVFAPPALITTVVATGPSTVESTSRAVPQEDVENTVPDTNSFEKPMTPTLVAEQHEVPHSSGRPYVSSVLCTPMRTYPRHQRKLIDRFNCT